MWSLLPVFILSLCFIVSGCSTTSSQLREDSEYNYIFTVNQNYQSVYRKILPMMRECFERNVVTAHMVVQADLYNDIKIGNISAIFRTALSSRTHVTIDVAALENNRAEVTVFALVPSRVKAVEEWVEDGSTKCDSQRNRVKKPDVVNEHQQ